MRANEKKIKILNDVNIALEDAIFLKKKKFNSQISRNKNSRKQKERKKVHKTMNGVEVSSVVIIKTHILYFSLLCYINV
jgi:hypothetical protein